MSSSIILSHRDIFFENSTLPLRRCIGNYRTGLFLFSTMLSHLHFELRNNHLHLHHCTKSHSDKAYISPILLYFLQPDLLLATIAYAWITVAIRTPAHRFSCFSDRSFSSDHSPLPLDHCCNTPTPALFPSFFVLTF